MSTCKKWFFGFFLILGIAASLFHYKELEIKEVKEYLRNEGISVRL